MPPTLRKILLFVQSCFNGFDPLAKHEQPPLGSQEAPVFLVGAPRTGSTYLFQLLARHYQVSYISNLMALLPVAMLRMARAWPRVATGYRAEATESAHGYVPGLLSPNEAGRLLESWFEGPRTATHRRHVANTFAALTRYSRAPVFVKNQVNTRRMASILETLPDARFLFLRRDPLDTAQSILEARRDLHGSFETWWSVRPPGWEAVLDRSPFYQAVWQVTTLEEIVAGFLSQESPDCTVVEYEDLCRRPGESLRRLAEAFHWQRREDAPELPERGTVRSERRLSDEEWASLEAALAEIRSGD